jgi:hypothetical protein
MHFPPASGAHCGARGELSTVLTLEQQDAMDALLALPDADRADALAVVCLWPTLPPASKAGILAMVHASKTPNPKPEQ